MLLHRLLPIEGIHEPPQITAVSATRPVAAQWQYSTLVHYFMRENAAVLIRIPA